MRLFLIVVLFTISFYALNAQVVINEFSASNLKSYPDDYAKYEDWVELYNMGNESVDLEGWFLTDKESKPYKWSFPEGIIISPKGYIVVWCSGRDSVSSSGIHTNFKLTQTQGTDIVMLSNSNGALQDKADLKLVLTAQSVARAQNGETPWLICTEPTLGSSNNSSEKYEGLAPTPVIQLDAGFYEGSQKTKIDFDENFYKVRYTTNGNEPDENSSLYIANTDILIQSTTSLKAKAFPIDNNNLLPSKIDFKTFFIDESFTVPVFSVAADKIQDLANGQGELRPIGTLEYFNEDGERTAVSYGELNRHGQDSWILPHRSLDWISRDEMGYNKAVFEELFTYSDRDEYQRFMFRASGDDNYPANGDLNHEGSCHIRDEFVHTLAQKGGMKLDVRVVERVVVFLNGEYWGLYGLRERPADHDYTVEYYDQDKYNLHYLATWGNTWAEYGGAEAFADWTDFRDFVLNSDMSIEENYEIVKSRFQVKSLCDYMIINLNTVASDWLNYNTGWWRGIDPKGDHKKWGYILWDNDATFDYYINYSGVPNTDPDAQPCDIDEISEYMDDFFNNQDVGKHEKIFLKLQEENDEFRQLYYSRQADLLNTVFSCDNMIATFDSMIATIEPEMPRQIARWGGSMEGWQENVDKMRGFITDRCTLIDDGMVDCFNLTGPYEMILRTEPENVGRIDFNTLKLTDFDYTGEYFGEMPNLIEAKSTDPNFVFDHWDSANDQLITPDSTMNEAKYWMKGPDTLIAVFKSLSYVYESDFGFSAKLFPTLVNNAFFVELKSDVAMDFGVSLINLQGSIMQSFEPIYVQADENIRQQFILNSQIIPGMYIIQIANQQSAAHFKVIVR